MSMNSPEITEDEVFAILNDLVLLLTEQEMYHYSTPEDWEMPLSEYEQLGDGNYRRKPHNYED